ncbi:hypothetical protein [Streptosporangium sp. KLBMP 9127]|nr:hypothetical protein [Streptosporangium sp. KLBMP 9127]
MASSYSRWRWPGLPEPEKGGVGFAIRSARGQVSLRWWAPGRFEGEAVILGIDHPHHPMARLQRTSNEAMLRAMADVLYAAGFTMTLRPGVDSRSEDEAREQRRTRCCAASPASTPPTGPSRSSGG